MDIYVKDPKAHKRINKQWEMGGGKRGEARRATAPSRTIPAGQKTVSSRSSIFDTKRGAESRDSGNGEKGNVKKGEPTAHKGRRTCVKAKPGKRRNTSLLFSTTRGNEG